MTDLATPNLPSRDFLATEQFYGRLGFTAIFRDDGWMILKRAGLQLEFFPHPQLDPLTSWFSCCLRLDDLDSFYAVCRSSGIPEAEVDNPDCIGQQTKSGAAGWVLSSILMALCCA